MKEYRGYQDEPLPAQPKPGTSSLAELSASPKKAAILGHCVLKDNLQVLEQVYNADHRGKTPALI